MNFFAACQQIARRSFRYRSHGWQQCADWLLPQACVLCGADSGAAAWCADCVAELPWQSEAHCQQCAIALAAGDICGACLSNPPAFDHTVAVWRYAWPIDRLIPALKYRDQLVLVAPFAKAMATCVKNETRPDCLLPMPLHPARLQARGFNQSQVLAQRLAAALDIPLRHDLAERIKLTPPQASLPVDERHKSIRGAFRCGSDIAGRHIAVVDDVMTSGASLNELAKTLKKAGASRVDCWVLARTPNK